MNKTKIIASCYGFQSSKPIYNEGKVITAIISLYFSIPLSILATIGNALILYAVRTTHELQKPLNLLLAFIAITDLLAGILAMPMSIAIRLLEAKNVLAPCSIRVAYRVIVVPLTTVSFLMMGSLSIDSLLACSFPLKHRTWQLKEIYKWIFITSWLIPSSILTLTALEVIEADSGRRCLSVIFFLTIVCITFSKLRIYCITRANNSAVGDMLSQAAFEQRRKKQKRLLKTLVAVILFFLVCHLPNAIVLQLQLNEDSSDFYYAFRYSAILTFLNSSLNPIIFCYRREDMRMVVLETLFALTSKLRRGERILSVE